MKKKKQFNKKRERNAIELIVKILAVITIIGYLVSLFLSPSEGYDRWIGKPFWWK